MPLWIGREALEKGRSLEIMMTVPSNNIYSILKKKNVENKKILKTKKLRFFLAWNTSRPPMSFHKKFQPNRSSRLAGYSWNIYTNVLFYYIEKIIFGILKLFTAGSQTAYTDKVTQMLIFLSVSFLVFCGPLAPISMTFYI